MFVHSSKKPIKLLVTSMRINQTAALTPELAKQVQQLGVLVARLRLARGVKQADAALRAGISRNTAYRLEKGDPGIAVGQLLRYLDAIASGMTMLELLAETDPALVVLGEREKRKRVRDLSDAELREIDF